jgi:transcriptional regulator with XRE-family HTH domain
MTRVTCPTCPLDRTYTSQARADYAFRQHSCAKHRRKAETAARTAAREAAVDQTPKPCAHPQAQHQHGTHACYVHDACRCLACRAANRAYENDRVRQHLYGRWNGLVDATPAREHILALMAQGMGLKQIVKVSGVSSGAFSKLIYGSLNRSGERAPSRRITPATAERVLAVKLQLADNARIPSLGAARRLQALVALGWSQHKIATRLGILPANFTPLILGRQTLITARHDRAVRALYDELSMQLPPQATPGQRSSVTRAQRHAKRNGWAPPLAWDDAFFDDPDGHPATETTSTTDLDEAAILRRIAGDRVPLTPAERVEVARRLVEAGWSQQQIRAQTGIAQITRLLGQEVA